MFTVLCTYMWRDGCKCVESRDEDACVVYMGVYIYAAHRMQYIYVCMYNVGADLSLAGLSHWWCLKRGTVQHTSDLSGSAV